MLFTSPAFYLIFLPLVLVLVRLTTARHRGLTVLTRLVIILSTYVFYGAGNPGYLIPFVFATVMDMIWGRLLRGVRADAPRRLIVAASVLQNLSIFFVFKYVNYFALLLPQNAMLQSIQSAFAGADGKVELPPGVSFYLFESLSYVIDCYRHRVEAPRNPLDFLTFISMFPRFIAGPIVRYADIEDSIHDYRGPRTSDGLFVFACGFVIKALLADSFAKFVDPLFASDADTGFVTAWISMCAYSFQIYLDFSGYSLMAIGLGMTLGFPFMDNFREPYRARGIADFWRRWHISLSTWLRDYLYIPLGGNRRGPARQRLNLLLTMVLGGIWHGANATFLVWGAYHGVLLIADHRWRGRIPLLDHPACTWLLVLLGWVWFRAPNPRHAVAVFKGMFGLSGLGSLRALDAIRFNLLLAALALAGTGWVLQVEPRIRERRGGRPWHTLTLKEVPVPALLGMGLLFLIAVSLTLSNTNIPFLYFQF